MSRRPTGDPASTAVSVLRDVGGAGNVTSLTSCFTRLRFVLGDESKVDVTALESNAGVLSVMRAGGQIQVVIGHEALAVREAMDKLLAGLPTAGSHDAARPTTPRGNVFNRFVALVSALFQPFLWVLAGTGLLKALIVLLGVVGWLHPADGTYVILSAGADALFYFLPMFLALTAAKRFGANQFVALALAGGLLYPTIVTLGSAAGPVTFLGLPVVMAHYSSSVVPIIVTVWAQGHAERWLRAVLPGALGNFLSPALVVLILFPLTLLTVGPATTYLSDVVAAGVGRLYGVSPAVGGFLIGGLTQVLVIFGIHWALIAVIVNEYSTVGHSLIVVPIYAAVAAQTGAALAVFLRTRDPRIRQVAGPATLSGLLAGITEPLLYGVNLPLRRPFVIGLGCGGLGGAVAGASGVASSAFAVPSLFTMPITLGTGNFPLFVAAVVGSLVSACALTLLFGIPGPGPMLEPARPSATSTQPAADSQTVPASAPAPAPDSRTTSDSRTASDARTTPILAPVSGLTMPVESMPDKVFASGALGQGMCVMPADGRLVAPVAGEVKACLPHAYGIRSDTGLDVLVHIGIDTARLHGEHFTAAVKHGDRVAAGDLLGTVDLDALKKAGYNPITAVMITNSARTAGIETIATGRVAAGDPLIRVRA